jgi:hypothetical protein
MQPKSEKRKEGKQMFEQAFKNIGDVLWKEAGCTTELDYTEQTSTRFGGSMKGGDQKQSKRGTTLHG